jgi:hypothetical protein
VSTHDVPAGRTRTEARNHATPSFARRLTTETKSALKTTELYAFVGVLASLFIAGAVLDEPDAGGLGAKQVWLYAVILTGAYMISRGLAKSGSSDPYTDRDDGRDNG